MRNRLTAKTQGPRQPRGGAVGTAPAGKEAVPRMGHGVAGDRRGSEQPHVPGYLQGRDTFLKSSTPSSWTSRPPPMGPGTSPPPSPKPALSTLGFRSHRQTLLHWDPPDHALFCAPGPRAGAPIEEIAETFSFPPDSALPARLCELPQRGRKAVCGQEDPDHPCRPTRPPSWASPLPKG